MKINVKYVQIKGVGVYDGKAYEKDFEVERPARVKSPEVFATKKCAEKNMLFGVKNALLWYFRGFYCIIIMEFWYI